MKTELEQIKQMLINIKKFDIETMDFDTYTETERVYNKYGEFVEYYDVNEVIRFIDKLIETNE